VLVGEFLLDLVAELFGAKAGGTVGIKGKIGVEILEEGGIIFLEEMNVGKQAVDDGNVRGQDTGLLGGG